jgi:hypothetical protein
MKVFLTSCETHAGAWRHQEDLLQGMWEGSSRQHELVDSPELAEVILVGNLRDEDYFASLRRNPVIGRYPDRCFVISEADEPRPLLRGIYTSAHRKLPFPSRFRAGAYSLQHPDFNNPFVERHAGAAFDLPKEYLFSFTGRNCHPVRTAILGQAFTRRDVVVKDTSQFNVFTHQKDGKSASQEFFVQTMEKSKFVVCPRGNGAASIRLFEAMKIGVAPIIISDDWILPKGPLWSEFALFVKEGDIGCLEEVATEAEPRFREMGERAAREYQLFFAPAAYFDYLIDQCAELMAGQLIPERCFWAARNLVALKWKLENRLRRLRSR